VKKFTTCRLCLCKSPHVFVRKLLNYNISYYKCPNCGYLQTEEPFWLEHAYKEEINLTDTGLASRSIHNLGVVLAFILSSEIKKALLLDYSGGYGLLTRLLRDSGVNAFWSDKYCKCLFSRGFEDIGNTKYDIVTSFEVLEHLHNTKKELNDIFKKGENFIFTTCLYHKYIPSDWWYFGLEHGQHIGFYTNRSMQYIAKQNKLFYSCVFKCYHIFTKNRFSIVKFYLYYILVRVFSAHTLVYKSKTWTDHMLLKSK
jgi:hypothetical protein